MGGGGGRGVRTGRVENFEQNGYDPQKLELVKDP